MRFFCGFDDRQAEACRVFAFSVERRSPGVVVEPLYREGLPISRVGRTSFSYSRFLVPHVCGYVGRGFFADGADQLCLADLGALEGFDLGGAAVAVVKHGGARQRSWSSVMVMDCARLRRWTPDFVGRADDRELMLFGGFRDDEIADLPQAWNVLVDPGSDPPPEAKIAHWSAISDPAAGPWIDCGRSAVWSAEREAWRAAR